MVLPDQDAVVTPRTVAVTEIVTRLRRVLRTGVRDEYPWEKLPMAQVEVLQRLDQSPGIRASDLAARHRLAPNTVSTLVRQMVDAGLISRHADQQDRRAFSLELTGRGADVLTGWKTANERLLAEAFQRLDPTTIDVLASALPALSALADALETNYDESLPPR